MDENDPELRFELARKWKEGLCPCIDGIILGDGRVRKIELDWSHHHRHFIHPCEWSMLARLAEMSSLLWLNVCVLCEATDSARGMRAVAGDGPNGADGFVALLKSEESHIEWIAFFQSSNPFVEVEFSEGCVRAKSNLNIWWRFPVDAPDSVIQE